MIEIPVAKRLEPYFKIAALESQKSPCIRRKYGAVIAYSDSTEVFIASHNIRMSPCCNENECVRNRVDTRHGGSVEVGGEIHAETSLLIKASLTDVTKSFFILVGYEKDIELYGTVVYPCHSCAMAIKFAGYKHIYIRNKNKQIIPVSIAEIIEYRIGEWESVD